MVEKNLKQKELEKFNDEILVLHITKLKNLKDEIKNVKSIRIDIAKDLEILEFWKIGYSQNGIPAMLIDESIPFLNNRVAYYLDKITSGRYTVSFDTMSTTKSGEFRDKISVNVLDNKTQANSRVQLSGGQTRMIDIATILTLNDLQSDAQDVSINILLFDEIFDSLDDSNIGYVSNVIRSLTKDRFVSIISHRHIDQIEADESLNLH
jgi:DNA repair exonuclease SbcCD ATPase subunit